MISKLLILTPSDNQVPSKTLDKNLNLLESYPIGMKQFYFDEIEYDNFHTALEKIFTLKNSFLVLGKLTDLGQTYLETERAGLRRKKGEKATIEDYLSTEIVLDLDDHIIEGFDPLKPEIGISNYLKEMEINCDVTWQITSSQKLRNSDEEVLARIRLYFTANKRYSLQYRKAWSQQHCESDGSVYTCSQPIYTAPPQIVGEDPIKKRHGFISGDRRTFILPKLTGKAIEKHGSYSRGTEYDFDDPNIPEEVLSGRVYRRYFMPLAFYYANKIQEREAIFYIIAGKAQKVKSREFSVENTYQYIDDALLHIEREKTEIQNQLKPAEKDKIDDLPNFPENIMSTWPEPWPMIWENFKQIPRTLEEPLLFPTVLALNAYFLRAKCITGEGRRPNLFFLNLTPSTGNKDVNSKNVIREIDQIFKRRGKIVNMFTGILNAESSITADTTFLQAFSEDEEFFWINTEATRIFQQIKQSGGISSVAALSDKLIEVVDGYEITGKVKASGKVNTINDPNAQILFYAQPETIERFIDDEMVDSGLFGRSLISIIPEIKLHKDDFSMFKRKSGARRTVSDEFVDFYSNTKWAMSSMDDGKTVLELTNEGAETLDDWSKQEIFDHIKENEVLYKLLTRLGNSGEQLYTIILGICQMYDRINNVDIRTSFDVNLIIPILRYWKETKIYAVKNLVNTELDPMSDEIVKIIGEVVNKPSLAVTTKNIKIVKDHKMIPISQVMRILGSRTKLIRKLDSQGDKRNAVARASNIIRILIDTQVLLQKEIDGVLCIGERA